MAFGAVSHKTRTFRSFSLTLAVLIFTIIALVNLTHSKTDFQSISCQPASCATSDGLNGGTPQPCLACMIVTAFQTAQVILFLLLLHIATLFGSCRPHKSEFHSIPFLSYIWVRGPPAFAMPS
jgi:hypothetical protein